MQLTDEEILARTQIRKDANAGADPDDVFLCPKTPKKKAPTNELDRTTDAALRRQAVELPSHAILFSSGLPGTSAALSVKI